MPLVIYIFLLLSFLTRDIHSTEHLENELRHQLPFQVCNYLNNLPKIDRSLSQRDNLNKSMGIINYMLEFHPTPNSVIQHEENLTGKEQLLDQMLSFITQKLMISMYLPAFPFKSLNTKRKVISCNVDMAEFVAILTLNHICCEIGTIYKHGAMITVISDGVAFRDLFPITDVEYQYYQETLKRLFVPFEKHLSLVLPSATGYKKFVRKYGNVASPPDIDKVQGLSIFAREEMRCDSYSNWKKLYSETTTNLGYYLAVSSDRFQRFLDQYPKIHKSIRLSIHPYEDISKKLSIALVYGSRGTPWHGVLVMTEHTVYLDQIRKIPVIDPPKTMLYTNTKFYNFIKSNNALIFVKEWTPSLIHSLQCHDSKRIYHFQGVRITCVYAPYLIIPRANTRR